MAGSTTGEKRTTVRGLGEIALRVNNLDAMQRFYAEVIGLPLMTRDHNCAFFKIAEGYGAHRAPVIAGRNAATSTIDHIAFAIPLADFADERKRLEALGLEVENRLTRMGALALSLCY